MIDKIKQLLAENADVTDYKINTEDTESYELFFVHGKVETVRGTDVRDVTVRVYADHDGKKGDSVFSVYASDSEEEIREKIRLAANNAKLIDNPHYTLPENETLNEEIPSNFTDCETSALAERIADAVFSADCGDGGTLNAVEIFLYKIRSSVQNSRGVNKTETKYRAMIEAIPTWNYGEDSVELYEAYHFTEFNAAEITAEIEGKMREVRDRYFAKKPDFKIECPVLFRADELAYLFADLTGELNYSAVFSQSNAYKKGDALQSGEDCDRITVTMKDKIRGSRYSSAFDGDGITLQSTEVIKDGRVASYYGANRFAQYLKEAITGNLICKQVEPGSLTEEALASAPYFECVSMSGLQLDIYNDYIGGEVRLAYYCNGEKKIPLTGISISGKLSEALNTIRLSETTVTHGAYLGPDKALVRGLSVL